MSTNLQPSLLEAAPADRRPGLAQSSPSAQDENLYLIVRSTQPGTLFGIQSIMPRDAAQRRELLSGRNPAQTSRHAAEQAIANALVERINGAYQLVELAKQQIATLNAKPTKLIVDPIEPGPSPIAIPLIQNGVNPEGYFVEIEPPNALDPTQDVRLGVRDKSGSLIADVVITLDDDNAEPAVYVTTDGFGDGDHNVEVRPLEPAEHAVSVDTRSSKLGRLDRPGHPGARAA